MHARSAPALRPEPLANDPLSALDEATRALYERVCALPHNRALLDALDDIDPARIRVVQGLRIVLVPGILYRDHPETGADGAMLREIAQRLSIPFDTIPLDGTEGLDVAADVILENLLALPRDSRVLLFSLSKGSTEVRHVLARERGHPAFHCIRAWVSVSGLPFGTPTFEMVLSRPISRAFFGAWFWLRRWKLQKVRELLLHRPAAPFELPEHMQFVQIAAFPRQADLVDRRSMRLRRRIASFGPNDGFAVLTELAALPGSLYPLLGADHYLRGASDLDARILRLVGVLGGRTDA